MSNSVFDNALVELARLFAAIEAETSRLAGENQRVDALRVQSRELSAANREAADQLAASRQEIADTHRRASEILDSARRSAEAMVSEAKAEVDRVKSEAAPHINEKAEIARILAGLK